MGELVIVSGERFTGKSTLCRRLVAEAEARGLTVGGLLTETVDAHTLRVTELHSGARYPITRPWQGGGGPLRHFVMDESALRRSAEALRHALPAALFVVDELGPTELQFGQGWIEAVTLLREGDYRLAFVVVRPALLHEALSRFGHPLATVAWVTVANRERLFDLLKARLEGILAGEAKG